jgi:hypothetical protein
MKQAKPAPAWYAAGAGFFASARSFAALRMTMSVVPPPLK